MITIPRRALASLAVMSTVGAARATDPAPALVDGTLLTRPDGLPDRLYAGDVYTTGGSKGHVLIVEGSDPARPAHWTRVDDRGAMLWEGDHQCPDFRDFVMFAPPPNDGPSAAIAVCKVGRTIVGVDLTSGREAWTFTDPRPLFVTVRAGDRVAVSVDNEQVAVIDAASGKEVMRLGVGGAVLEAATTTAKGPVAFLVRDSGQAAKEFIELPVGEANALEKVPLSGDDPGRQLVAVALGGPAKKGISKPKVLWAVPFGGWSFDLFPTAGAIVGEPSDGRVTAYDVADGHVLWERPEPEGEVRAWGKDGGVAARTLAGGGIQLAASDAKLGKFLWDRTIDVEGEPLGVGADDGDVGLVWATGFHLADFKTGAPKLVRELAPGEQIVALRSTPASVLWVVESKGQRTVRFTQTSGH